MRNFVLKNAEIKLNFVYFEKPNAENAILDADKCKHSAKL